MMTGLAEAVILRSEHPVKYFAYGPMAAATYDLIKPLIDRKPDGYPVVLNGYQLSIQTWQEIPENVRKILAKT